MTDAGARRQPGRRAARRRPGRGPAASLRALGRARWPRVHAATRDCARRFRAALDERRAATCRCTRPAIGTTSTTRCGCSTARAVARACRCRPARSTRCASCTTASAPTARRRAHPGRRLPRRQRGDGGWPGARRLRERAVAPRRLGRRLPAGAVADLLVLVAAARRRRRRGGRGLPARPRPARSRRRRRRRSPRDVEAARSAGALMSATLFLDDALGMSRRCPAGTGAPPPAGR